MPSLQFRAVLFSVIIAFSVLSGCGNSIEADKPWTDLIPAEAPVTYKLKNPQPIDSLLASSFAPFLNDITASSVRQISEITSGDASGLSTHALYLFPSTANHWKPVWITRGDASYMKRLRKKFSEKYTQNEYFFKDQRIQIVRLQQRKIFVTRIGPWILLSENSLALEESIRSYTGISPALKVSASQLKGPKLILNTPYLDQWVKQLSQVTYRPSIDNIFMGTEPIVMDLTSYPSSSDKLLTMTGVLSIKPEETSVLVESITTQNASFQTDAYIPKQAASYGIFHLSPSLAPPKQVPRASELDSLLMNNASLYRRVAETLHPEYAIGMFSESGYLSKGEHFFLRRLSNKDQLRENLEQFTEQGLINYSQNIYNVTSQVLARLFGSSLSTFDEFYLGFADGVLVMSKRRGLTESVISDWRRGRVISEQEMHQTILKNMDPPLSALVVAEGRRFLQFIEPYLSPDHYVDALVSQFDVLSMGFRKQSDNQTALQLDTYKLPETTAPYREKFAYALSGTEITAQPVLADIGGSPRKEIIFATRAGKVHGLASDGTEILQTSTGTQTPVGPPLVYDWYGNGQNIILQAAGDKIYGWNTRGNSLPQFPMQLNETISAPPQIADVNRDGIPELIVATSNRKLHVLDGRGQNIAGWPQKTNSIINTSPVFKKINQHWSVVAFAANTMHAWLPDGNLRPGFPKFIQATFRGKPLVVDNHIYGNAADGHLYAISETPPFADSISTVPQTASEADSLKVTSVQLSDRGLTGTPSSHTLSLKLQREDTLQTGQTSDQTVRDTYLLTASSDGTIYFIGTNGNIRQTYRIKQTLSMETDPFVGDLHKDNSFEVFVLSRFGRLFTWNLDSGRRSFNLPTQSMQFPLITDIDEDGNLDLIAQSQNGIRCWVLLNP